MSASGEALLRDGPYISTVVKDSITTQRPKNPTEMRPVKLPVFVTVPMASSSSSTVPPGPFPVCVLLNGFQVMQLLQVTQCADPHSCDHCDASYTDKIFNHTSLLNHTKFLAAWHTLTLNLVCNLHCDARVKTLGPCNHMSEPQLQCQQT